MKKKKPSFLTYDLIRQDKFRSPEKIQTVEKLLQENDHVINWWCRQSGKTLTSLKIARDRMIKEKIKVIFVCTNTASTADVKVKMARCINRELVSNESVTSMTLKNGSMILFMTPRTVKNLKRVSLLCVDEFEFFSQSALASLLKAVYEEVNPSLWTRFKEMFNSEKTPTLQTLFASSMKNRENFKMVRAILQSAPITYMNYEKINYGPGRIDEMKKILPERQFKTEYNSYFPQ